MSNSTPPATDNNKEKTRDDLETSYERANLYKNLLAHDMANILTSIRASIELTDLYLQEDMSDKVPQLVKVILDQINRGKNLIQNVQHLSELENLKPSLKKTNLTPLIKESIKIIEGSTPYSKKLTLNFKPNKTTYLINANAFLVDVFHNILSNAILHNENELISIEINLSLFEKDNDKHVKVEIKDNGIGIEDGRKKNIFKGIRSNSSKGMGLGLSLVKEVIDAHNGDIWVENRVKGDHKKGSNFVIILPLTE